MIDVEIEDEAWTAALPEAEALVLSAAQAALGASPPPCGEGVGGGGVSAGLPESGAGAPSAGESQAYTPTPTPPRKGEGLTVLLTDDTAVRELNARFRGKDYATNVLSFPAPPNPENHLGDIALAYGVCAREAGEQGKPLAHHLQHLVAHGVLHLLGYDHETDPDADAMEGLEREILAGLGIADPYAAEQGHDA